MSSPQSSLGSSYFAPRELVAAGPRNKYADQRCRIRSSPEAMSKSPAANFCHSMRQVGSPASEFGRFTYVPRNELASIVILHVDPSFGPPVAAPVIPDGQHMSWWYPEYCLEDCHLDLAFSQAPLERRGRQ